MKVLIVHKTYRGGVAVHVKEISRDMRKRGIKVDEITRNEDLKMLSFRKSFFKMKKMFEKWSSEYDVIHVHDWSIAYPALKANKKNIVATFHAFPTNVVARYFENYCIRKLKSNAIVISPSMKKIYKNTTYIPNGVNLQIFKKNPSVKREKNLVGLAQKYSLEEIERILDVLKLKHVYTGGKWDYEKLGNFYSSLDIFISIPYRQAGFNLVWLEALACEVPFIIGTNDGIGSILPIYKVSDFGELKEILQKIVEGKLKPIKNQRKWIVKNGYAWTKNVDKLLKIYGRIK